MDVALRKLKALVKELGSQRAVAKHLGVSDVMVSDLMAGRRTFSDRVLKGLGLERIQTIQETNR